MKFPSFFRNVVILTTSVIGYFFLLQQDLFSFEQQIVFKVDEYDFDDEYGYPTEEYLPLWEWEKDSIGLNSTAPRICNPPEGVPRTCCVGALSHGAEPVWQEEHCRNTHPEKTEPWTKEYMKGIPYESGRPCDVCEIAHLLAKLNWTLALQGDSVTNQVWEGLVCEFARRGFPIKVEGEFIEDTPETNPDWLHRFTLQENLTVTLSNTTTVTLRYYRAYRSSEFLLKRSLSENDMVVFDHGLHYPPNLEALELLQDMRALLNFSQNYEESRVKVLAWRETTAQHFSTFPGGYYLRYLTDGFPRICGRINENFTVEAYREVLSNISSDHLQNIGFNEDLMQNLANMYPRNKLFEAANTTENFTWVDASDPNFLHTPPSPFGKELVFLPFRDYTKEVTYLHNGECTHYCANPFLWQPVWRDIRLALQRQAKYL